MSRSLRIVLLALFLTSFSCIAETRYVDKNAPVGGDGLTWATAFRDLQDALEDAAWNEDVLSVFVTAGSYSPDRDTGDQTMTFVLPGRSGFRLLGGFRPGGSPESERDIELYETVLTGDLLGDDETVYTPFDPETRDFSDVGTVIYQTQENTFLVMRVSDADGVVTIDGITVEGGRGSDSPGAFLGERSDIHLRGVTFRENLGRGAKGAVHFRDSPNGVLIDCCVFERNAAGGLTERSSPLTIRNSLFIENTGGPSGAIKVDRFGDGPHSVTDCVFVRNSRRFYNGGGDDEDRGGGAISAETGITVARTRFEGNTSGYAAGAFSATAPSSLIDSVFENNHGTWCGGASIEEAIVERCTFIGNSADRAAAGLRVVRDSTVRDCIFDGNESVGFAAGGVRIQTACRIESCEVTGNTSALGAGGVEALYDCVVIACTISANTSGASGGGVLLSAGSDVVSSRVITNSAMAAGGGIFASSFNNHIINTLISANIAGTRGGGVASDTQSKTANLDRIAHCTVVGNSASSGGGIGYLVDTNIANSILWGNIDDGTDPVAAQIGIAETVSYAIVEGASTSATVSGEPPMFLDALGPDGDARTGDEDFRLLSESPALDVGSPDAIPRDSFDLDVDGDVLEPIPFDLRGLPRVRESVSGPAPDLGVFEFHGLLGCNDADLASPLGELDLADITAFVDAFVNGHIAADAAAPFEIWDLADIINFVSAFAESCVSP